MEMLKEILLCLNECAGLFALLALVAAIFVPIFLYKKQKKDEFQAMQDEYDAANETARLPMTPDQREFRMRESVFKKAQKRYKK